VSTLSALAVEPPVTKLALAAEIWKLAEEHMRIGTHDLLAFVGPEFQRLTDNDMKHLYSSFGCLTTNSGTASKTPFPLEPRNGATNRRATNTHPSAQINH